MTLNLKNSRNLFLEFFRYFFILINIRVNLLQINKMFPKTTQYPLVFLLPLIAYLLHYWFQHIIDRDYWSYLDTVNLMVHEFGHVFFGLFWSEIVMFFWGTLMQLLIPMVLAWMFFVQRDGFGIALCIWIIGANWFYISWYAGDAQDQLLPLIWFKGGEGLVRHDWTYIFSHYQVLEYTNTISEIFFIVWNIFFLIFFIYSVILCVNKFRF